MRERLVSDADLHALVDGQVHAERRQVILDHLKQSPADASRVELWRRQNEAIRSVFSGVAKEPVPVWLTLNHVSGLRAAPRPGPAKSRDAVSGRTRSSIPAKWRGLGVQFAVSLGVALAVGLALPPLVPSVSGKAFGLPISKLWAKPEISTWQRFDRRVIEAHQTFSLDPDHPIEIADETGAILAPWFARRLDAAFRVPRLGKLGWTLRGGRLTPGDNGPAALLVYQNGSGDRLSLYVARSNAPPDRSPFHDIDGNGVLRWSDGSLAFGLVSTKPDAWLGRNARDLQDAIIADAPPA